MLLSRILFNEQLDSMPPKSTGCTGLVGRQMTAWCLANCILSNKRISVSLQVF